VLNQFFESNRVKQQLANELVAGALFNVSCSIKKGTATPRDFAGSALLWQLGTFRDMLTSTLVAASQARVQQIEIGAGKPPREIVFAISVWTVFTVSQLQDEMPRHD